jgi:poly(A) polymerase
LELVVKHVRRNKLPAYVMQKIGGRNIHELKRKRADDDSSPSSPPLCSSSSASSGDGDSVQGPSSRAELHPRKAMLFDPSPS